MVRALHGAHTQEVLGSIPGVVTFLFLTDEDVIQVHAHHSFGNEVAEDIVYHSLEGSEAIGEAKEHD